MKLKTLLAIALFAVLLVSATAITAYAARGGNSANAASNAGKGIEKASSVSSEKAQERLEDAQERLAELKENIREKLAERARERLAVSDENESDENETENETAEKIAPGRLISQVQQARREVWQETKEILQDAGYHGRVDEFQRLFNQFTRTMKTEIREKIESGNNTDLSAEVVREIAKRELTKLRDEVLAKLNITAENITDEIENATNETNETINTTAMTLIAAQLAGASPEFRGKLFIALQDATSEEKAEIIAQLNEFASSVGGEVKELRIKEGNAGKIREQLKKRGHNIREILAD